MNERPALGFEYELALAKVDTTETLTFAESPYPPLIADFSVLATTRNIRITPPAQQTTAVRCGYNPSAQRIPVTSSLGAFFAEWLDQTADNSALGFHGEICVARLVAKPDFTTTRTLYLCYLEPRVTVNSPEGDGEGTVRVEGTFTLMRSA